MNFVEELKWRGMIHDMMPGTEEQLQKEMTTGYVGIDPTADSLHIGHLVTVMMLKHMQVAGHRPIVLVGGATGMIGDPSGKSDERNLLDETTLRHNQNCIKEQLSHFLDFDSGKKNQAIMVNNYDWMKEFSFLGFIRDIGKHITVNYMMAKDSVKKRISGEGNAGLSFTEFTYQLVQGTDFYHLYNEYGCKLQMGGSDQWGNITTGTELIRRLSKDGEEGKAFAMTCPLITKADGGKFGKTESGNIWLDPKRTSPYKFYQFWLNASDEDAEKYIKIFTLLSQEKVEKLVKEHAEAPHARALQKRLAEEITVMIHGREAYEASVEASQILFGKSTMDALKKIDEDTFLAVFEGVPMFNVSKDELESGIDILELLAVQTEIFPSKGEARKTIKGGGVSLNKEKITVGDMSVNTDYLLNDKYLLVQKGKKNFFVVIVE
ncbi:MULTISPECIES: tyrosine--tRNA ligase [unclassified Saccharicrinis]|uniref:tyrosine--tRNA ligase n=1 Tax=unclassified Saccharicrinis TaxID=2646859 RepID=UPI003D327088